MSRQPGLRASRGCDLAKYDAKKAVRATHTGGQDMSPLQLYLDNVRMEEIRRGRKPQDLPSGPAVLIGSRLIEHLNEPRKKAREKKLRAAEAQKEKQWASRVKPFEVPDEMLQRLVRKEVDRMQAERFMQERPQRIKKMRLPNGRIRGLGVPRELKGAESVKELDDWVWGDIDEARHQKLLHWRAGEEEWEEYEESMADIQHRIDKRYDKWRKLHKSVPLAPMWEDENVTYPVRNRLRKYQDETFYKITYHSHGIPQFYDRPRGPYIVPARHSPQPWYLTPCLQCQSTGLPSRCTLTPGGCATCRRKNLPCLSLNPWDVEEVKNGNLEMAEARGWWVEEGIPDSAEGLGDGKRSSSSSSSSSSSKEARLQQKRADAWKAYYGGRMWDYGEWCGGEKGFVRRNPKSDSWALPRFEKDEMGRPERDEKGKIVPYRS